MSIKVTHLNCLNYGINYLLKITYLYLCTKNGRAKNTEVKVKIVVQNNMQMFIMT